MDAFVPGDYSFDHCMAYDFGSYRANPFGLLVNKHGRRFMDESVPYSNFPDAVYNYDTTDHSFTNIPAFLIFDQRHVDNWGWPDGGEEQPAWVGKYDTLEELAEACGIDATNLAEEVARFNGFCETGVDPDFDRGSSPWAVTMVPETEGLANKCLGPVEAPYYVAITGPGSLCTKGGLTVDLDNRVIDALGNPIEGLFASGTTAASPLGWTYGGGGGGNGPGFYGSFNAVCKVFGLDLI